MFTGACTQKQLLTHESVGGSIGWASASLQLLGPSIVRWVNACADYYAAAALYEHLRGLSDAELQRRGLSRQTLAQDVCVSFERTADR